MVGADEAGGGEPGAAEGALRLLVVPLGDAVPAEDVAAGRRRRVLPSRQAQRAAPMRRDLIIPPEAGLGV